MGNNRINAIMLAVIAAILVMLAGKSCSDSMNGTGSKKSSGTSNAPVTMTPEEYAARYGGGNSYSGGYQDYSPAEEVPQETTEDIQYVTSMLGKIIGTVPPEEDSEEDPQEETEEVTEPTKSMLEQYNDSKQGGSSGGIGGFDHGRSGDEQQPDYSRYQNATFPDDFTLQVG